MANTYLTSNLISKEAVALFKVFNSFITTGYRKYEGMYSDQTYKSGDTINVRLDNFYEGERGDSVTAESIVEASIPVTIGPLYSVAIAYTPTDLTRKIADFSDEVLAPAVRRLIAMMNKTIQQNSLVQVNYFTGSALANLNSYASLDQVNPIMDNLAMDAAYKRYAVLNPIQQQQLRSAASLQNSFLTALNREITMDAMLGRLADFDIYKDQNVSLFTAGNHAVSGDVTVKTTVASGSTIVLTGFNSGATMKAGDVFSIAGTYEFNQITRSRTTRNMQFTVTQDAAVSGSDITVQVYPAIQFTGPRQNIDSDTGTIASGSVVTLVPSHLPNICYTERGLITCMPALARMDAPESDVTTDREYGVSLRVSKTADVLNNKNIMRLDAQLATSWVPQQAVRLVSALGS